jgi:hypothetical protein
VFDRFLIAEKIWGFSFNSGTNVIDVHINSLRKKIDKDYVHKAYPYKKRIWLHAERLVPFISSFSIVPGLLM